MIGQLITDLSSRRPLIRPVAAVALRGGSRRVSSATLVAFIIFGMLPCLVRGEEPADRFVESVQRDTSLPGEARRLIQESWANCEDCDGAEFLTQGLALVSEPFRAALDAYDQDKYDACASIMHDLVSDKNPFIASNAAAYEIKSLIILQRLPEAASAIESLLADDAGKLSSHSYFAAEIEFLRGFCFLGDLQYDKAVDALSGFLSRHSEASQRLTLAAKQMLAELANRQPGQIGEVVDLMTYSGRRLINRDSGETVRTRQDRIIELLDRLIEDAEEQEQSGGGGGGGGGGSSGKSPSNPMEESQLPGGGPGAGPLRESRRASPGESWGAMQPAQREKILQALRDSFPGRYRRLVEQYYEQLAK